MADTPAVAVSDLRQAVEALPVLMREAFSGDLHDITDLIDRKQQLVALIDAAPPARRAEDGPTLAAHPGLYHEFRTTCLHCGEPGFLHVGIHGPDEKYVLAAARLSETQEPPEGA